MEYTCTFRVPWRRPEPSSWTGPGDALLGPRWACLGGAPPACAGLASDSLHHAPSLARPALRFLLALPGGNAHPADPRLQPWLRCPLDLCQPAADVQHFWCLIKHQFTGFLCTRPVVWVAKWARQRAAFLPEGHPLRGSQPSPLL